MTRRPGWLPWAAGYGSLVAGVLSLAAVPALASGGTGSVLILAATGLAQVLWGAAYILEPGPRLLTIGSALQGAALGAAAMGSLPVPPGAMPLDPTLTFFRLAAGLFSLAGLLAGLPSWVPAQAPGASTRPAVMLVVAIFGAGLWGGLWAGAASLRLPSVLPTAATAARATPTPHPEEHPGSDAHQTTFRVRLSRQPAGPYRVDAFTGPTEVGHLFVEVRVADETGRPVEGLTIDVEARPSGGDGAAVEGLAILELAEVPGNYAVDLPVPSAGFWDVEIRIAGPQGVEQVGFSERIGGTANVAGWVLAGVPLAIAVLFGIVYLRMAGRRRG